MEVKVKGMAVLEHLPLVQLTLELLLECIYKEVFLDIVFVTNRWAGIVAFIRQHEKPPLPY